MAKQSRIDRTRRLEAGRCPVHGIPMGQIKFDEGQNSMIVGCGRKDCVISAIAETSDGPWKLPPEHEYLLK